MSFLQFSLLFFVAFTLSFGQEGEQRRQKFGPKEIKKLLDIQDSLKAKVREYVKVEEERIAAIRALLAESENIVAPADRLGDPVTVFRIIKSFVRSEIFAKMQQSSDVNDFLKDFTIPDYWDLETAGVSVIQMAEKKKMTPKEVADKAVGSPLTFEECFHIGRMAYGLQDYYHAAIWMEETWTRMQGEEGLTNKDRIPVLDFWSYSLYQEGNLQRAWWMTKQVLEMDPENERFKDNLPHYETEMKEKKLKVPKSEKDLPPIKYESVKEKDKKKKKEL